MEKTKIQWSESTQNFWTGCDKVSKGCTNCYMWRLYEGTGRNPRNVFKANQKKFNEPLSWTESRMIFTCSMSDFFIADADEWREEAWNVIRQCPQHTWQILTKRPERIKEHLPADWGDGWDNVWLGVSLEDEEPKRIERLKILSSIPAKTRFISAEPLLAPINFKAYAEVMKSFHWCIVGGESGNAPTGKHAYRVCKEEWMETIVTDLQEMKLKVFVKQMGTHIATNKSFKSKHGDDMKEWKEELQVREFPKLAFAKSQVTTYKDPDIFTGKELMELEGETAPMLLESILIQAGLGLLIGGSDVGKSFLGLDLAIAISNGEESYAGSKLNLKHKRSIAVFTEDFAQHVRDRMRLLDGKSRVSENIVVICSDQDIVSRLEKILQKNPVDFIFVDMLTDVFGSKGSLNQTVDVRLVLAPYKELARKYNCLILFNHHTGKGKENNTPSKNDGLGSQGIEAACRTVLHLGKKDGNKRILTVVKGNHLPEDKKNKGIELELNIPGGYVSTGNIIAKDGLSKKKEERVKVEERVRELQKAGKQSSEIVSIIQSEGYGIKARSSIYEIINLSDQKPKEKTDGQEQQAA